MLSPVLTLGMVARALRMTDGQARDFIQRFRIPVIDTGGKLIIDAGICERVARRELGQEAASAIRAQRDEDVRARAGHRLLAMQDSAVRDERAPENESIEEMLVAAIEAHDGVLSFPLFRAWAVRTGRKVPDPRTICTALEVPTWTAALAYCGGRRGVTTPNDRAAARDLIATALAEHGGRMRMDDYIAWAAANEARWRDAAGVARAAGFPSWSSAIEKLSDQNPTDAKSGSGSIGEAT